MAALVLHTLSGCSSFTCSDARLSFSQQRGSFPRGDPSLPHGLPAVQRAGGSNGKNFNKKSIS